MARNITIFELHFDGARFGPTFGDETADDEEAGFEAERASEYDDTADGSRVVPVVPVLAALAVGFVVGRRLVRRFRSDGSEQVTFDDVEATDDETAVQ